MKAIITIAFVIALGSAGAIHHGKELAKRDRELIRAEWSQIQRELADERLMEFLRGNSKFVDEADLLIGSPAIVEAVQIKIG